MFIIPKTDFAAFLADDGLNKRRRWVRSLIEASVDWFTQGGRMDEWMSAFQEVRTELLTLGWTSRIPQEVRRHVEYIRLGSSARGEDLYGSDLDFAIVTDGQVSAGKVKVHVQDFLQFMVSLGFPACQGFVMGTNPRWIGTQAEWKRRVQDYFSFPDWKNARYLFMMVDGQSFMTDASEWTDIVNEVREGIRNSPFICWEMAHLGIHKTVAIDWLGRVRMNRVSGGDYLQVKQGFINPIVHSIRLLSLREGYTGLSTLDRISFLQGKQVLSKEISLGLEHALTFAWKLRLFQHFQSMPEDGEPTDAIAWCTMKELEREEARVHLHHAMRLTKLVHRSFRKPRRAT